MNEQCAATDSKPLYLQKEFPSFYKWTAVAGYAKGDMRGLLKCRVMLCFFASRIVQCLYGVGFHMALYGASIAGTKGFSQFKMFMWAREWKHKSLKKTTTGKIGNGRGDGMPKKRGHSSDVEHLLDM